MEYYFAVMNKILSLDASCNDYMIIFLFFFLFFFSLALSDVTWNDESI